MIFQATLNGVATATVDTPFIGVYNVKLVKIDYHFTAPITQELCQITSRTLINQTPLSGRIVFLNSSVNTSSYGDDFLIGKNIRIAGPIDLTIQAFGGGPLPANYLGLNITLKFEKVDDIVPF